MSQIGYLELVNSTAASYPTAMYGAAVTTTAASSMFAPSIVLTDVTFDPTTMTLSKGTSFESLTTRGNETVWISDKGSSGGTAGYYDARLLPNGTVHIPSFDGDTAAIDLGVSAFGVPQQVRLRGWIPTGTLTTITEVEILGHGAVDVYQGLTFNIPPNNVTFAGQAGTMFPGKGLLLRRGFSVKANKIATLATVFFSRET
jgi:hypothetical protein